MDDIRPLREAVDVTVNDEVTLFKPANPIRGVYNAAIQYYLPEEGESITIEIKDAQGNLINTYTGTKGKEWARRRK